MKQELLSEFQPLGAIATTPKAIKTLQPLCQSGGGSLWLPKSLEQFTEGQFYEGSLKNHLENIWVNHRALVFCLATGAVIRLIAPLLNHKATDPAVVVIDPEGKFVISLSGGHQGGADLLTRIIAQLLGATPILTGAAANSNLPAIDTLGFPYGWKRGTGDWTAVSGVCARGEKIQVIQEVGSTLWQNNLPDNHPFEWGFSEDSNKIKARIWISPTKRCFSPDSDLPKVQWHPRVLWVGIGCEKDTSQALIKTAVEKVCESNHLATEAIAGIATIDLKAQEEGILALCKEWNLPIVTFNAPSLSQVKVPNPSEVVKNAVGTPSVAEAAAILAAKTDSVLVTKQVYQLPNTKGAVTVAIAVAEEEYTGRCGKLFLVGIGPGDLSQMTTAAKAAIVEADAIVGYKLYVDLIASLLHPGQIIEALNITEEQQRAKRAMELARWGLTVAVISSGDCGIYGMAGLVLEALGEKPLAVEIFPGVSAIQSAASRVGTPLMHDFCAISLSDLLTPWSMIEKRLEAAAVADFVTAIYNPRSRQRTQQIIIAQKIFLEHRAANTPVAIVRAAYRPEEHIELTTLDKMLKFPIDMLTTVIIGNSKSYYQNNWMITPRIIERKKS